MNISSLYNILTHTITHVKIYGESANCQDILVGHLKEYERKRGGGKKGGGGRGRLVLYYIIILYVNNAAARRTTPQVYTVYCIR